MGFLCAWPERGWLDGLRWNPLRERPLLHLVLWGIAWALAAGAIFLWLQKPVQYGHYKSCAGPAHDVLLGKSLLHDTPSIYGYFSVHAYAVLMRELGHSMGGFHLSNILLHVLYYLLGGMVLSRLLKDWRLVVPMFFVLLCLQTLFSNNNYALFPSSGAMRFLPGMVMSACLVFLQWRAAFPVGAILAAISVFWSAEVGAFVLPAWLVVCLSRAWLEADSWQGALRRTRSYSVRTLAACGGVLALVLLSEYRPGVGLPHLSRLYEYVLAYRAVTDAPRIPAFGNWYMLAALHVFAFVVFAHAAYRRLDSDFLAVLGFSCLYNVLAFSYYVAESYPNYVVNLTVPALLEGAAIVRVLRESFGISRHRIAAWLLAPAVVFCLLFFHRCQARFPAKALDACTDARENFAMWTAPEPAHALLDELCARFGEEPVILLSRPTDTARLLAAKRRNALPLNPLSMAFELPHWKERYVLPALEKVEPGTLVLCDMPAMGVVMDEVEKRFMLQHLGHVRDHKVPEGQLPPGQTVRLDIYRVTGRKPEAQSR